MIANTTAARREFQISTMRFVKNIFLALTLQWAFIVSDHIVSGSRWQAEHTKNLYYQYHLHCKYL